jgi:RHS repeat-associated protein
MCPGGVNPTEVCGDGLDNDLDGCADDGCTFGTDPCDCTQQCDASATCEVPGHATCDPRDGRSETCGDGEDNDCDGVPDDGCAPPSGGGGEGGCCAFAGRDPISLPTQSVVTEPFTDFGVEALTRLSLTRTYTSADASLRGGRAGPFGKGWHHDWEATLSCREDTCTVGRGITSGFKFRKAETVGSLDGTETWQMYRPAAAPAENRNLLARRPSGAWVLFLANGEELHFATVCDSCGTADEYCIDPLLGGKARIARRVDARGVRVEVRYDRPAGVLIQIEDELGHALALRSGTACTDGLARELRFDDAVVATYEYAGVELLRAADADGTTLRAYTYDPSGTGLLLAVQNAGGAAVAQFSYDLEWRAIGVVDPGSSVGVSYGAAGTITVTEHFGSGNSATGQRTLDPSGRVLSISDGCACGPPRTYAWEAGAIACSSDAEGRSTSYERDSLGRVVRQVQYAGSCPPVSVGADAREEWTEYGMAKTIAAGVTLALDSVTSVSRMSALTWTKYAAVTLSYDPEPQSTDPVGYTCQQAPLPTGSVVCRETAAGYTYDSEGAPFLQRTVTFFSYDARGRLIRTLGPMDLAYPSTAAVPFEERTYWPDTESLARRGRLMQMRRYASSTAAPLSTTYDYDAFGPYRITQPNGAQTIIVKDARGRPIVIIGADGHARTTRYYDGLDPSVEVLPSGAAVRTTYDALGRRGVIELPPQDPDQPGANPSVAWSEHHTYDLAGNPVRVERRDASGATTWRRDREYDVQRRVVRETHPEVEGVAKTQVFDGSGFLAAAADEVGRTTSYTYDGLGRVTGVRRSGFDAGGAPAALDVAQYAYRRYSDSLFSVIDGKGQVASYAHDDFGRLRRLNSPNLKGGEMTFSYDARGNLIQKKDVYTTVSYTYDGLDRLLTTEASHSYTGSSVAYTYRHDEAPNVGFHTSVIEPERTVRYGYDKAGRLARESIEEKGIQTPLVTEYAYDPDGGLATVVYPSGLRIAIVRDPATRMVVEVVNASSGTHYAREVAHAPGGPVARGVLGNGLTLIETFTHRYEPATVSSGPVALTYEMTPAGEVGSITEGTATRTFEYDHLGRITGSPGWLAYGYDENGNRTSESVNGALATYRYVGGTDQPNARAVWDGTSFIDRHWFAHDLQGHASLVGAYDAGGAMIETAACLRHDALDRMVLAGTMQAGYLDPYYCSRDEYLESVTARFKYDAHGRRIARQNPVTGRWTYVVSDRRGNPLSELELVNGAWTKVRDYVWLDGRALAQLEYPGPAGSSEGYAYYFHLDHIGLPRALTNAAGHTVWSAEARPYGDLVETTSADPLSGRTVLTNLRLPGQYDERLLGSVGLQGPYYNWNRWYLPGVGRYLELDPLALQGGFNTAYGVDWYGYGLQNPMKYWDPWGMVPCTLGDTTYTCCLKKYPGCPECCGAGEPPPKIPVKPGEPPPQPKPPPTCETQPPKQPPQPEPFRPDPLSEPGLTAGSCAAVCSKYSAPVWPFCMAVCLAGGLISGPL